MNMRVFESSAKLVGFRGFKSVHDVSSCVSELANGRSVLLANPFLGKRLSLEEFAQAEQFFASLYDSLTRAGVCCTLFSDPLLAHDDRMLNHSIVLQSILRRSGIIVAPQDTVSRIASQHGLTIMRVITSVRYEG